MIEEICADVKGYEGFYQVSTLGQVRSIDRIYEYQSSAGRNYTRLIKGQVLKQTCYLKYMGVALSVKGVTKNYLVHRLVAEAFISNPDNLPQVNHKDEDPSNNCVDNLEWCSASYNVNYGKRNNLVSIALKGRPKSPEHVEKVRKKLIGHTPWNKGLHTRPIVCLDAGLTFTCVEDAANWIGQVTPEAIQYVLKRTACCKGHVFVYADSIPENVQEHIEKCKAHYRNGKKSGRPCKCIEDNMSFKSILAAAEYYKLSHSILQYRIQSGKGVELSDKRIVHFEMISYDD